jgi:hypothetical protein
MDTTAIILSPWLFIICYFPVSIPLQLDQCLVNKLIFNRLLTLQLVHKGSIRPNKRNPTSLGWLLPTPLQDQWRNIYAWAIYKRHLNSCFTFPLSSRGTVFCCNTGTASGTVNAVDPLSLAYQVQNEESGRKVTRMNCIKMNRIIKDKTAWYNYSTSRHKLFGGRTL